MFEKIVSLTTEKIILLSIALSLFVFIMSISFVYVFKQVFLILSKYDCNKKTNRS